MAWGQVLFFREGGGEGGTDPRDKAGPFTGVDEELNKKLYALLRRED